MYNIYQAKTMETTVKKDTSFQFLTWVLGRIASLRPSGPNPIVYKFHPSISFNFAPVNPFSIGSLFKFNERLSGDMVSGLWSDLSIYITCPKFMHFGNLLLYNMFRKNAPDPCYWSSWSIP